MSKSNGNTKNQNLLRRENQTPATEQVSLDNADTVIEGGPPFQPYVEITINEGAPPPHPLRFSKGGKHNSGHQCGSGLWWETTKKILSRGLRRFHPFAKNAKGWGIGLTPRSETVLSSLGCSTITSPGSMVVSTTLHRSGASFRRYNVLINHRHPRQWVTHRVGHPPSPSSKEKCRKRF
jgi:hypothetical protein